MKHPFVRAAAAVVAITLSGSWALADMAAATKEYATLLEQYATTRGVRYQSWRDSGADLKMTSEVVMLFRSTEPAPLEPNERKALYINLYNAKVVESVLFANVKGSFRDMSKRVKPGEIYDRIAMNFDGKALSLNGLEKKLRDEFKDPRVHFAVNNAARSCPPLRPEPYVGATLDTQLDDAARAYLASPGAVTVIREGGKATLVLAKFFDWYADDFKASGGVLGFLQKFGPQDVVDAIAGGKVKIEFADYDWGLNAAK